MPVLKFDDGCYLAYCNANDDLKGALCLDPEGNAKDDCATAAEARKCQDQWETIGINDNANALLNRPECDQHYTVGDEIATFKYGLNADGNSSVDCSAYTPATITVSYETPGAEIKICPDEPILTSNQWPEEILTDVIKVNYRQEGDLLTPTVVVDPLAIPPYVWTPSIGEKTAVDS